MKVKEITRKYPLCLHAGIWDIGENKENFRKTCRGIPRVFYGN